MLANLLFGSVIFYGALTWANPPWTVLSLLEGTVVVSVTIIGFTKSYFAAGGDENGRFAVLFNCLTFGTWFWSTAIVWAVYWGVHWLFRAGIVTAVNYENMGLARNLAEIGGSFEWLWTVIAVVMWQVLYFTWLRRCLARASGAT